MCSRDKVQYMMIDRDERYQDPYILLRFDLKLRVLSLIEAALQYIPSTRTHD